MQWWKVSFSSPFLLSALCIPGARECWSGHNLFVNLEKADWMVPTQPFLCVQESCMDFLNDPLKVAADWLEGLLTGWGLNAIFAHVIVAFLGILLLLSLLM